MNKTKSEGDEIRKTKIDEGIIGEARTKTEGREDIKNIESMNDSMKYRLTEIQKIENMKTLEKNGSIE